MQITLPEGIETAPTASLVPYAGNARMHTPEQVRQIAASIVEFGFTNPVLVDAEGGIIAGHGRVMAAHELGLASVPIIRLGYLDETRKRAYVLADNQLAQNSSWDFNKLALELGALDLSGFDTDLLGFDPGQVDALIASLDGAPLPVPDAPPAATFGGAPPDAAGRSVSPPPAASPDRVVTDPAAEWQGMPEFNQPGEKPYRSLVVHFRSEEAVRDFAARLGQELSDRAKFVYHPEEERADLEAMRYEVRPAIPDLHPDEGPA